MERLRKYAIVAAILGLLVITWNVMRDKPAPVGEWRAAEPDRRIDGTGTSTINPKRVAVYNPPAKDKLDLPDQVKNDPSKHVTSAVIVKSDERPQSVVTIFDQTTGQTTALTQRMEYPLLAAEQRGQIWIGYGQRNGGQMVGRILIREDLLQVKALHAGVNATLDADGAWFAGAGVGYRW
jgi:hypothetical protein